MSALPPWLEQLVEDARPSLPATFTGCIELHCSIGEVATVHWEQTAKPKPSREDEKKHLTRR